MRLTDIEMALPGSADVPTATGVTTTPVNPSPRRGHPSTTGAPPGSGGARHHPGPALPLDADETSALPGGIAVVCGDWIDLGRIRR